MMIQVDYSEAKWGGQGNGIIHSASSGCYASFMAFCGLAMVGVRDKFREQSN
jgi:hypothetical protein